MAYTISAEKIKENWDRFEALCQKLGDRTPAVNKMLEDVGDRLAMCPASGRVDYHACFPGGLVDHSLRVLNNAYRLAKSFEVEFPKESIIMSCLFHDLGKLGDEKNDRYLPQSSDWHRNKGMLYEHNEKMTYMTVPHQSIYLLQRYGVRLTQDEMLAILLNDGQYAEENRAYRMKETMLALIVHQADCFSTHWEKTHLVEK